MKKILFVILMVILYSTIGTLTFIHVYNSIEENRVYNITEVKAEEYIKAQQK